MHRRCLTLHLIISAAVVISTGTFACGKTPSKSTPTPFASASPPSSATVDPGLLPLELGGTIYDPTTGNTLRPANPGERTRPPLAQDSPAPSIKLEKDAAIKTDVAGKMTLWRTPLTGYIGGVRPPHAVQSDDKRNRVMVTVDSHLVGLDLTTGKQLWTSTGREVDRLFLDDDLVFATICSSTNDPTFKRQLVARKIADGESVWSVELPLKADPNAIDRIRPSTAAADRLFVITDRGFAWFFTRDGKVPIKLTGEELIHASPITFPTVPRTQGLIVMTSTRIAALDLAGTKRWELPAPKETFVGGGGVAPLPNGDIILYGFGRINDSGVELIRLRPLDGSVVYRAEADRLGVPHSEYYHSAFVRSRGTNANTNTLDVVSIGSGGAFVEVRSADTGALIKRWKPSSQVIQP